MPQLCLNPKKENENFWKSISNDILTPFAPKNKSILKYLLSTYSTNKNVMFNNIYDLFI